MTKQNGNYYNDDYQRQGAPTNTTWAESVSRTASGVTDLAIAASGVVLSVGVPLNFGDKVTNITFVTGATAASGPTAGFAALYSPAGALLAQTADFGSTARAANTAYTVALATAQTISTPGLYYVALSFTVSTTVPTVRGVTLGNAVLAGNLGLSAPILAQTHGSAVGATAPATITGASNSASLIYVVCT